MDCRAAAIVDHAEWGRGGAQLFLLPFSDYPLEMFPISDKPHNRVTMKIFGVLFSRVFHTFLEVHFKITSTVFG